MKTIARICMVMALVAGVSACGDQDHNDGQKHDHGNGVHSHDGEGAHSHNAPVPATEAYDEEGAAPAATNDSAPAAEADEESSEPHDHGDGAHEHQH